MFSLFRRCSSWSTAVGSSLCRSRCAELETSSKVLRESGFPIRKLPLVNTKIYLEDVTVHKQAIPSRHGVGYAAPFDEAKPTLPSRRFDHGATVHADRYLLIFAGPLSMNDLQVTHLPTLEAIPSMVAGVWSEESTLQLEATTQFRKSSVSNERSPPIKEVIQSGVVPRFVEFLMRKDFVQLQFEAAWALTNIASGTSEDTRVVIDHGTVPIFVKILSSPSDDVHEQAVWALGNVAGDSPKCHGLVLGNGVSLPGPMRRRAVTLFQLNHMAFQLNFRRYFTPSLSDCYQIREQGLLTQRAIWYCRDIIWNCVRRYESGIRTASSDPSTVKFNGVSYSFPIGGIEGGLYKLLMHACTWFQ